jgi:hypothetical protein
MPALAMQGKSLLRGNFAADRHDYAVCADENFML